MVSPPISPLLLIRSARIDVGGAPTLERLSLETHGARVLVLGAPRALFEAVSGQRPVAHGDVAVLGMSPEDAVRERVVASAPLDPNLPARWTVRAYATWSARLAGHATRDASALAAEALHRLRLTALAEERLARAPLPVRRAVVIAAALATGAQALLVEDPLAGIPDEAARTFGRVLLDVFAPMRVVTFAGRTSLGSLLAAEADEAIVLAGSDVVAQGAPGEIAARTRSYALRVQGDAMAFAARATARGVAVVHDGARIVATLPDASGTRDLFGIALESESVIVEMRPVAPGFG